MRFVVLDFETFFSQDYSLSKLSTEAYVRGPEFAVHGAAIKWDAEHVARWYPARHLGFILKEEDWSDVFLICHHTQFDGLILSHHYGVVPAMYGCTLSMARAVLGTHVSVSLDSVRSHFGLAAKRTPYDLFKGKRWEELSAETQAQIADGACDEAESIWQIFGRLADGFPAEEYSVIDQTIRMFTQPCLVADTGLLGALWESEEKSKQAKLEALSVSEPELQSADKFSALLSDLGVEIEYKNGKNGAIPAFAKTDQFMRDLLEHDNERVRLLAAARLGVKSTLLQTRAEALGWMASRGPLCVPLSYWGAHTGRWAGTGGVNFQNLKRDSDLRRAIMAPPGYLLGIIDLAQIECRLLNYLAGQQDVIEKFTLGHDPYIGIASKFYGRKITKADRQERGTGKQAELSCGYGCGAAKFQATAKLGIYGEPVALSLTEARKFVDLYRRTHAQVTRYWRDAEDMIKALKAGESWEWGPMQVKEGKIYLPNGSWLDYRTVEYYKDHETGEAYWRVRKRHGWSKLYGGKLVENAVQALARVVLSQAMLRLAKLGFRTVTTSHDELVILIPESSDAGERIEAARQEMMRTPDWLPGIPLDAEATLGRRYSK